MKARRIDHRLNERYYLLPKGSTTPKRTIILEEKPLQQPSLKYILGEKLKEQFYELHDFNGDWSNLGEISRHLESKNNTDLSLLIEMIEDSKLFYAPSYQKGNKL